MITRILNPSQKRSFLLLGPRQTGKSTYVKTLLKSQDLYINLLPEHTHWMYAKDPAAFRQEILAHQKRYPQFTCIVDEVQKIPSLLDEVHDLIETYPLRFILTGSSARKLRRGASNLLAGRANHYRLYPLTVAELGDSFDLERALHRGLLPYLWAESLNLMDEEEFLRAYTDLYLREEIQAEGIVRHIAPFARFLDIAANNDGEIVNYSNIARECAVSVKTVQEYYQILEDTFLAYRLDPWFKSIRKRLVAHPRYYFFDMGITNALCYQYSRLNPIVRGRRFEQFILQQLLALNAYHRSGCQFFFWRTHTGIEVDLILTRQQVIIAAIEIKSSSTNITSAKSTLNTFREEYPEVPCFIISTVEKPRLLAPHILALSWQAFLSKTWFELTTISQT